MFRKDINGLRAIAVIAVVIFHFQPTWMEGGFAGVDVFFVISGFLMTGIIFRGLEFKNFSFLEFYVARANRIIPALALLCISLLILGMIILSPSEYKELGWHVFGSIGFFSNILYWSESGYFESASHGKWLLHTWSLSVEWQFYLIYPLLLFWAHKYITIDYLKKLLLILTIVSFVFCIFLTYKWPSGAYYLLPSRIWEMLLGGLAYIYPLSFFTRYRRTAELTGIVLIVGSYFFVTASISWPGYVAFIPVFGTYLIIQAKNENSVLTGNFIFQKIGAWSYSIYLWHWPVVVAIYYYSLPDFWIIIGCSLSIFLGYLSYRFIEKFRFKDIFSCKEIAFKCIPVLFMYVVGMGGLYVYKTDGTIANSSGELLVITKNIIPSPFRNECHTEGVDYTIPRQACTYFNENVSWALIGDSHGVELAYALATELDKLGHGLKHLTFSGCIPSFKQSSLTSSCAKWTNESVDNLLESKEIENIVISYRYSAALFGDQLAHYPDVPPINSNDDDRRQKVLESLTQLVEILSNSKKNVFIIKPIPELGANINILLRNSYRQGKDVGNIHGTSKDFYLLRNEFILNYFNNTKFPKNVKFIDPLDFNCSENYCWAIRDSIPLYFDDDHLSVLGATPIAIEIIRNL